MERLLRESDIIHALAQYDPDNSTEAWMVLNEVSEIISNLPHVNDERWIPCSEKMPADGGTFLVSCEEEMASGYVCKYVEKVGLIHCNGLEWFEGTERFEDEYRKVIAWMPVPEPYKGEEK